MRGPLAEVSCEDHANPEKLFFNEIKGLCGGVVLGKTCPMKRTAKFVILKVRKPEIPEMSNHEN